MAHITLSIPDMVYKEMKQHPEIKWSEIARQSIIEKTILLKKSMPAHDLLRLLPPDVQKGILAMNEPDSMKFYKKMKEHAWKRTKYLTQA